MRIIRGLRRRWWAVAIIAAIVVLALGFITYRELGRRPLLALELLSMAQDDRRARNESLGSRAVNVGQQLSEKQLADIKRVERVDARNSARLKAIVDKHGWPGRSLVGRRGAEASWLIAQHAQHEFQKVVLRLMNDAGPSEVDPENLAFLTDRVLVREGRDQIYGTQFTCSEGRRELVTPLADAARVDEFRQRAGMPSFAENKRRVDRLYGPCPK